MVKRYAVKNLAEYIDITTKINNEELGSTWFRGHSSASHRLKPSVLRGATPLRHALGYELKGKIFSSDGYTVTGLSSERMLDEFKRKARPFLETIPSNDFEWLFLMQHYGVPTRLLDWTTNALVALFFAVEYLDAKYSEPEEDPTDVFLNKDECSDDGAAVFVINPQKINKASISLNYAIDVAADYQNWSHYVRPMESADQTYSPICILAPHTSPRIRAQSGTFTLHGSNIWPIDYYDLLRPLITKIFIPYKEAINIREQLSVLGITRSFIFPDLVGVSEEIKLDEIRRHQLENS